MIVFSRLKRAIQILLSLTWEAFCISFFLKLMDRFLDWAPGHFAESVLLVVLVVLTIWYIVSNRLDRKGESS